MKFADIIGCYGCFCLVFCVLVASSTFTEEAASTLKIHRPINAGSENSYYYESVPTYRPKDRKGLAAADEITPRPYRKYIACAPRTFLFRGCSLCFCTDVPMVAYCWDYEGQECREMQRLMEEQTKTKNNDPSGVW